MLYFEERDRFLNAQLPGNNQFTIKPLQRIPGDSYVLREVSSSSIFPHDCCFGLTGTRFPSPVQYQAVQFTPDLNAGPCHTACISAPIMRTSSRSGTTSHLQPYLQKYPTQPPIFILNPRLPLLQPRVKLRLRRHLRSSQDSSLLHTMLPRSQLRLYGTRICSDTHLPRWCEERTGLATPR